MNKLLIYLLVALLGTGTGFFAYRQFIAPTQAITPAPALALSTLDGGTLELASLRGKLVLINFWATWCPPCLKEIPLLVEAQARYGARGLQVLGPALDDPERVKALLPRLKIPYPVLVGDSAVPDAMDALGDTLGALPYSVLISPDGYVIHRKHGEFTAEELAGLVEAHLP